MKKLFIRSVLFCTTGFLISSALSAQSSGVSPIHTKFKHQYTENKTEPVTLALVLVRK